MTRAYSVLFVDDDPLVLEGLGRTMRPLRGECSFRYAGGGAEALALMESEPVDVIVSDMHMPAMSGRDLLLKVRAKHPQVVRFLLSGNADRGSLIDAVGCAHQFLSKPCEATTLRSAVLQSVKIRDELDRYAESSGLASINTLPSLPTVYQQVLASIRDNGANLRELATIIERDPGLTSTLLKAANSAFFGAQHTVTTLSRACTLLGLEMLSGLVLNHELIAANGELFAPGRPLAPLPDHSFRVGALARRLCLAQGQPLEFAERAFLCGLLHDIGKLVLHVAFPPDGRSPHVDEAHPHLDHSRAGGYLLALWGFPDSIVTVVASHHDVPHSIGQEFTLSHAVCAANALVNFPDATTPTEAGVPQWEQDGVAGEQWWLQLRALAADSTGRGGLP